jgi:hypothetical protein
MARSGRMRGHFSGVARVDKCSECRTLCALTRPYCQKLCRKERGVEVRHTGDTVRGFGTFAVRQINTGIIVAEYLGRVVESAMLDELYGGRTAPYAIRLARTSVYSTAWLSSASAAW